MSAAAPRRPHRTARWPLAALLALALACPARAAEPVRPSAPAATPPGGPAGGALEERARQSAARIAAWRKLLDGSDRDLALATLDEMARSTDAVARELALDIGLNSAEAAMRAVALRARLLVTKTLVFELYNANKLAPEQWDPLVKHFNGERLVLFNVVVEPNTGVVTGNSLQGRLAGQELQIAFSNGALRVRLGEGGVLVGSATYVGRTVPLRLAVQ